MNRCPPIRLIIKPSMSLTPTKMCRACLLCLHFGQKLSPPTIHPELEPEPDPIDIHFVYNIIQIRNILYVLPHSVTHFHCQRHSKAYHHNHKTKPIPSPYPKTNALLGNTNRWKGGCLKTSQGRPGTAHPWNSPERTARGGGCVRAWVYACVCVRTLVCCVCAGPCVMIDQTSNREPHPIPRLKGWQWWLLGMLAPSSSRPPGGPVSTSPSP